MFIFIDESGELSNYTETGSNYFICTAALMYDSQPCEALNELRHQLEHDGYPVPSGFHAKNDPHPRRLRVFQTLAETHIFVHSVALKKERVYENLRNDEPFVYRLACRMLLSYLFKDHLPVAGQHSIVFGTWGSGAAERRLVSFLIGAVAEFGNAHSTRIAFWDAPTHTGLQIADYCVWLVQRGLEIPDENRTAEFRRLMAPRLVSLYKPFDT